MRTLRREFWRWLIWQPAGNGACQCFLALSAIPLSLSEENYTLWDIEPSIQISSQWTNEVLVVLFIKICRNQAMNFYCFKEFRMNNVKQGLVIVNKSLKIWTADRHKDYSPTEKQVTSRVGMDLLLDLNVVLSNVGKEGFNYRQFRTHHSGIRLTHDK